MKVDRNGPEFPFAETEYHCVCTGITLRLEIAKHFVAAMLASGRQEVYTDLMTDDGPEALCEGMVSLADVLIDAHNATCGEVAGE